jgi:hypothetical protein
MGKRHYPPAMDHPNGASGIGLGQLGVALRFLNPERNSWAVVSLMTVWRFGIRVCLYWSCWLGSPPVQPTQIG